MPRRKGRRRGGRNRAAYGVHIGDEFLTFSIKLGTSQNISLSNISTRPKDCNLRILSLTATAAQPVVPGPSNGQIAGYLTSGALDLQVFDNTTVSATSKPQVLGSTPRKVWVRSPRGKGNYPYNAASNVQIGQINAVCLGRASLYSGDAFIRGILHIRYSFSYEILIATCPAHLCDTDPNSGTTTPELTDYEVIGEEGQHQGHCAPLPLPGSAVGPSTSTPPHLLGVI